MNYHPQYTEYKLKLDPAEKDILISKLKSQIIEYDDNAKNYESLSKKYHSLKQE